MRSSKRASKPTRSRAPSAEATPNEPPEEGLSVDADELGAAFLRNATEQDNFESLRAVPREFALPGEPPSDDAPAQPAPAGSSLWDSMVDRVLGSDPAEASNPDEDSAGDRASAELPESPRRGVVQVDLTRSVIEESSVFDAEGEELGEVVPAQPETEDAGRPGRTRGR